MKLAEELYQGGFISYPRTETDAYDPAMDLRVSSSVSTRAQHSTTASGLSEHYFQLRKA
jgi:DNA topoisomerase-3